MILIIASTSFGQNKLNSETIENIAEELSEESDAEEAAILIERLQELAENPVRINSGMESEISRLFFLSDFQLKTLTDHIRTSGKIVSVYEIASIPGFDRPVTEMLIPFITLVSDSSQTRDSTSTRSNLIMNLSLKPDKPDTSLLGNGLRLLVKYRISAGRFTSGITTEKDAGEKLFPGKLPVTDFFSGYISYSGTGHIKKIIAGDFSARFGLGTNISSGTQMRIPLTSGGFIPGRNEVRPYTSTDENRFFRGIAGTLIFRKFESSILFSHKNIDATYEATEDSSRQLIRSIYTSGLHNTTSSLSKKDILPVTDLGGSFSLNLNNLRMGITYLYTRFGIPVSLPEYGIQNLYRFSGNKNSTCSFHYNSQFSKILIYGEISTNDLRRYSIVQGISLRPSDRLTVNAVYRNYSPGYITFNGKGPGISDACRNEEGVMGNFSFEAARHLFIVAGADICRFPWLKYRTSSPSLAERYEAKISYIPDNEVNLTLSYSYRYNEYDSSTDNGIPDIESNSVHYLKGSVKYSPASDLALCSRIDVKHCDQSGSTGILMSQDIVFNLNKIPVSIWFRYCIYNTDDWDSRLYVYENDLLYSFSIPALSGKGTRSYIMFKWEPGRNSEIRLKYGNSSVSANNSYETDDEIRLQVRLLF